MFEKLVGPMEPGERRLFTRIGIPGLLLFLVGSGAAIAGDLGGGPGFMAWGLPMVGVGFVAWAIVCYRLIVHRSPALKAWDRARVEASTSNRFNAAASSTIVLVAVGMLFVDPSPLVVVIVVMAVVMLVGFLRHGWPE